MILMSRKKTTEEFKEEIYELVGNEYVVISEYINNKTKVKFHHNKCNKDFEMRSNNFLRGNRCPNCINKNKKIKRMNEEVFKSLLDNDYSLISPYKNLKENVTLLHLECNREFEMRPDNFLYNNQRCPYCVNCKKYTIEDVKNIINNEEYKLISDNYVNNKEKLIIKHLNCNKEFKMTLNDFKNGNQRCPYCQKSKGEIIIQKYLSDNNIFFETEKRFDNCKDKRTLPFDFYLEDYNLCIEYDGEQHYKQSRFKNSKDKLELTQKHDRMKDDYCKKNGIKLLRISYKEKDDIEKIIDEALFEIEHSTII